MSEAKTFWALLAFWVLRPLVRGQLPGQTLKPQHSLTQWNPLASDKEAKRIKVSNDFKNTYQSFVKRRNSLPGMDTFFGAFTDRKGR